MKKTFTSIIACILLYAGTATAGSFDRSAALAYSDLKTKHIGWYITASEKCEIYQYTAFTLEYEPEIKYLTIPAERTPEQEHDIDIIARMLSKEYGLDYRWDKTTDINQLACANQMIAYARDFKRSIYEQAISGAYVVFGRSAKKLWNTNYTQDNYENALVAYFGGNSLPFEPYFFNTCKSLFFSGYKKHSKYAMKFSNVGYWSKPEREVENNG